MTQLVLPSHVLKDLDLQFNRLAKGQVDERDNAMRRLEAYEANGTLTVPILIEMADEANVTVMLYATQALGRNGSDAAVEKLLQLLTKHRTGNPLVVQTLVEAMGLSGSQKVVGPLLELIGLEEPQSKGLLGKLKGGKTAPAPQAPPDGNHPLVLPILKALENIADHRALERVACYLDDPDAVVRWHALKLIKQNGNPNYRKKVATLAETDPAATVRDLAKLTLTQLENLPAHSSN